ncbi:prostaglandin E receptor 4 (subtype EP4) c [Erpetoichthys calabaricus]|uniref:prostaglandin E receptor 4 (subtype EP4) c n=1 Tax=Erpetoichthys calabaricus TaxID=27687 RepID=UPI0022343CF2|nr:prostaglandin E receptor 4 (subtype EP4) c [Erpetoichthys calabaricus]
MLPTVDADFANSTQIPANTSLPLTLESRALATSASMFVVGVLGNLIAIVVLCTSKKEQKETTFYTLVCGLAVTDLLGTCFTSPVVIATYITGKWPGGYMLCDFFSFSMLFFGSAGMSILCAMAIERYLAINHAYFYSHYVDRTMARLALAVTYIINVVLCIMPSFGFGAHVRHFPGTWCFLDWRSLNPISASFSYLYGGFMILLIAVTVLCNLAVCGSLVRMSQRARLVRAEVSGKDVGRPRRRFPRLANATSAAEIQMFWLLIFMTIVFLVCSIPLVVQIFINQLYGPSIIIAGGKPDYRNDILVIRFASFNPILDPWVYILCRKNLLTKGCERVKRTVGIAKEDHTRKVGWISGQHTPPSYINSVTTSYASLQIRDERHGTQKQADVRTKSFTDFTIQQTWDLDISKSNFHPFSLHQDTTLDFDKHNSPSKPIVCNIVQETSTPEVSKCCEPAQGPPVQRTPDRQFEMVTCTFSTPTSCVSEKCI